MRTVFLVCAILVVIPLVAGTVLSDATVPNEFLTQCGSSSSNKMQSLCTYDVMTDMDTTTMSYVSHSADSADQCAALCCDDVNCAVAVFNRQRNSCKFKNEFVVNALACADGQDVLRRRANNENVSSSGGFVDSSSSSISSSSGDSTGDSTAGSSGGSGSDPGEAGAVIIIVLLFIIAVVACVIFCALPWTATPTTNNAASQYTAPYYAPPPMPQQQHSVYYTYSQPLVVDNRTWQ